MTMPVRKSVLLAAGFIVLVASALGGWGAYGYLSFRYQLALQTTRRLEDHVTRLQAGRQQLVAAVTQEQQRVADAQAALSKKELELAQTISRLLEEERTVLELQDTLASMQEQFDGLQGELAVALHTQAPAAGDAATQAVRLEKVIVTPSAAAGLEAMVRGRVVSVHPEWNFVVMDLGWKALRIGDVVSIYRGDALLAKARVERVQEQVSAASLLPDWASVEIRVNDEIRML